MTQVNPIPEDFPTVTPHLCVDGAGRAIEFYSLVFGARERLRQGGPGGTVWHAELVIGNSVIIVADEFPNRPGMLGPRSIGGTPGEPVDVRIGCRRDGRTGARGRSNRCPPR